MPVLADTLNTAADAYRVIREAMLAQLALHDAELAKVNAGGGPA